MGSDETERPSRLRLEAVYQYTQYIWDYVVQVKGEKSP